MTSLGMGCDSEAGTPRNVNLVRSEQTTARCHKSDLPMSSTVSVRALILLDDSQKPKLPTLDFEARSGHRHAALPGMHALRVEITITEISVGISLV